ncbi:hypothetical protein FHW17_005109 [Phyllobacterium sp. P30BS-XVII]|nr:hypothetical protein [Phyllobacterium sp. P30BS-XVII]
MKICVPKARGTYSGRCIDCQTAHTKPVHSPLKAIAETGILLYLLRVGATPLRLHPPRERSLTFAT